MKRSLVKTLWQTLLALTITAFLTGCGGALKRAESFLEKGMADEAIQAYEAILTQNPNDPRAKEGLTKARLQYLDQKLIAVRKLRMAGSELTAGDLLQVIITKEILWVLVPPAQAAFTQEEELQLFSEFAFKETSLAVQEKKALRAEYIFQHYQDLLFGRSLPLELKLKNIREKSRAQGKTQCQTYVKSAPQNAIFYRGFIERYCTYFNQKPGSATVPAATWTSLKNPTLYSKVKWTVAFKLDPAELNEFTRTFEDRFQKSAWYEPKTNHVLNAKLQGNFKETHHAIPISQRFVYFIDEPFTEYVQVQKTRAVPRTTYKTVTDLNGGTHSQPIIEYEPETYYETEARQGSRRVEREFTYDAISHDQRYRLTGVSEFELEVDSPLSLPFKRNHDVQGIEHHEHQPQIGLYPTRPKLVDRGPWLKESFQQWIGAVFRQAELTWVKLYCQDPSGTPADKADQVFRCVREELSHGTPIPASVQTWFETEFSLKPNQVFELISRR